MTQKRYRKRARRGNVSFGKAFLGTMLDPLGTIISLARKQKPSWMRGNSFRGISPYSIRNSANISMNSIKDKYLGKVRMRKGRSMPYFPPEILLYPTRHQSYSPFNTSFATAKRTPLFNPRHASLYDTLASIVTNPTFQNLGKSAALSVGEWAIPRGLKYIVNKIRRRKQQEEE